MVNASSAASARNIALPAKELNYPIRFSILLYLTEQKNVEYQEKELLICESCGAVITTKEHLHFMHRKLGPKAFSSILNLNLLNQKLKACRRTGC